MQPLVCVIIPTYQREKWIKAAIESVLHQTFNDFELIVVDDGSTDRTAEIVSDMASRDRRIRYLYQTNRGPAGARNRGLQEATAEVIAFLDSDDLWKPEKLQLQMETLSQNADAGFVYCSGCFIDEEGNVDDESNRRLKPTALYSAENILFDQVNFLTPGVLFRKHLLAKAGPFDESLEFLEDVDLWFRILCFTRAVFLDQELILIRRHTENLYKAPGRLLALNLYRSSVQMRRKLISFYERHVRALSPEEERKALHRHEIDLIKESLAQGFRSDARSMIVRYLKSYPGFLPGYFYFLLSLIPGNFLPWIIAQRRKRL